MKVEVTMRGHLTVEPEFDGEVFDRDDEIEQSFSETTAELVALRIEDPSVSGSVASGAIEITMTVEADSLGEAIPFADSAIRSAFQAGGETHPARVVVHWNHAEADVPASE